MDYKTYEVRIYTNGDKYWCLSGQFHREDGPAIERTNGYKSWWLNGKRHRVGGPAVEWANGSKHWYFNDKRHREDGPAIENSNSSKSWYLNGEELTEEEFVSRTKPTADCAGRVVEIDGKKYTLEPVK